MCNQIFQVEIGRTRFILLHHEVWKERHWSFLDWPASQGGGPSRQVSGVALSSVLWERKDGIQMATEKSQYYWTTCIEYCSWTRLWPFTSRIGGMVLLWKHHFYWLCALNTVTELVAACNQGNGTVESMPPPTHTTGCCWFKSYIQ